MLNFLSTAGKTILFIVLVLVFGQLVFWNGRSISDHIKVVLNSTQNSRTKFIEDAREAVQKEAFKHSQSGAKHADEIDQSARNELQGVLNED